MSKEYFGDSRSKEYVGDSRNDCFCFFSYLRNKSVWTLSQNLQISRFFCKIREEAMEANCLILPVTGYAHVDVLCGVGIAHETMNGNHDGSD